MKLTEGVNFIKFYEQHLCTKIPKAQEKLGLTVFFALLGPAHAKAAHKILVELTPEGKSKD